MVVGGLTEEEREREIHLFHARKAVFSSLSRPVGEEARERDPFLPVPPVSANDWGPSCSSFACLFLHMSCSASEF